MSLLVAEMQYQDPLDPQSNTEYVAQLAQMSSLSLMQELNTNLTTYQSFSLVGKYVYGEYTDSSTSDTVTFSGVVDSVVSNSGSPYVVIDDEAYSVDDILQVFDASLFDSDSVLVDAASLIGKYIEVEYTDDEGDTSTLTGIVTAVTYEDGIMYATFGDDNKAPLSLITSVSDSADTTTDTTDTDDTTDTSEETEA